jgi:hypothetical protein
MLEALAILRAWWKLIPGFLIGAALAFPLGQCSGHRAGVKAEQAAEAKRLEAARAKVASREHTADKITTDTSAKLEKTKVKIQWRTKTIIERIPSEADPSRGSLPNWFVSLHDSAVLGLPEASGGSERPDESPSGVTDPEAARVIIGNVGIAQECEARLAAWTSFYDQLRATYNAK